MDPILAQYVGKKADFGVKKHVFLKKKVFAPNHFLSVPRWSGTFKKRKLTLYTRPMDPFEPILWAFWANLGSKNAFFSENFFLPQIILFWVPDRLGPSKSQNWPFIPPNGPHSGVLRLFRSPRNPLGLAHKSSALFKP